MNLTSSNRRIVGYAVGGIFSSLMYVGWFMESMRSDPAPYASQLGFGFRFLFASFWWLTEGFALTLLLMIVPWSIAVAAYVKFRRYGQFYFPAAGALIVFMLGCGTASISWKPLFIDDQTFLQSAEIGARRRGLGFILSVVFFGVFCLLF